MNIRNNVTVALKLSANLDGQFFMARVAHADSKK